MARIPEDADNSRTIVKTFRLSEKQLKALDKYAKKIGISRGALVLYASLYVRELGINPKENILDNLEKEKVLYKNSSFFRVLNFYDHSSIGCPIVLKQNNSSNIEIFKKISHKIDFRRPLNLIEDQFFINNTAWSFGLEKSDLCILSNYPEKIKFLCSEWYPACQWSLEGMVKQYKLPISFFSEHNAYYQVMRLLNDNFEFVFCSDINILFSSLEAVSKYKKLFEVCGGSDLALYRKGYPTTNRTIFASSTAIAYYHLIASGLESEFNKIELFDPCEVTINDIPDGAYVIKTPDFPCTLSTMHFQKIRKLSHTVSLYVSNDFYDKPKNTEVIKALCNIFIFSWNNASIQLQRQYQELLEY